MALTPSWPGPTGVATTTDGRKAISGLIVKNSAGVPRSGVFPRHGNDLVTARADMNVDIGIFEAAAVQFGGTILLTNDAVAQLPSVLVSPGAGTNYYVIYAKQNESTAPGTDANNNRVFGAQLSTTSFAVARAAMPAGAVELATVQMPTGKTATNQVGVTITQTFQYTATAGGVVGFRTKADLDLWTNPSPGQRAFVIATGREYGFTSGAWFVRLDAANQLNPGGAVTGIDPAAAIDLPNGLIMKTGALTQFTSVAFGNEYFATVTFTTPFPNKCLHVSVTPLLGSPATDADTIALDTMNATSFRAMVPGSVVSTARAFTWFAVGY